MAEAKSLLSLIARGYAAGREDAATEALCFILVPLGFSQRRVFQAYWGQRQSAAYRSLSHTAIW